MSDAARRRIWVVQWATGTVGAFALRGIIEHPDLELVGVRVFSAGKDGADAGELCGLPATGIRATRDTEAILALRPDCVVYMPDSTDIDVVCRLLEGGSNIVTTRPDFFNPEAMTPALRQRVEAACRAGQSSIHSTGSSPGFITEVIPLALLSVVRRLDFLALEEYANCREGCSEEMLTELMGFGDTPEGFARRNRGEHASFEHSMTLLASAVGLPIEKFESSVEIALCTEPTKFQRSTIPAGTVGAQRVALTGFHGGEPVMRFRSNWFVTRHIDQPWTLLETDGWQVTIEGDTPLDVTIRLPMPVEEDVRASGKYTAHRPVNAIPYVVAAPPGIVPTTALAQVVPNLARRKAAERPG
jgi:hypothetical protein